jgi:predicted  nucleic acid-binding Zn ribbon protein
LGCLSKLFAGQKLAEERAERIKAAKIQEEREAEILKAQAEWELVQEAEMCGMSLDEYRDYKSQKQIEETENTLKQLHQRLKENAKKSLL